MFTNYEKPKELLPLAMWVFEGESGQVMCLDCKCEDCYGCPVGWRQVDGETEYWRMPMYQYPSA